MAKQEMDVHVKPPDSFKSFYKRYQKISLKNLDSDRDVVDFSNLDDLSQDSFSLKRTVEFPYSTAQRCGFVGSSSTKPTEFPAICVYEHHAIPGLEFLPRLFPPDIQWEILERLLHRDLANPLHKTNVHTHYDIPYELCTTGISGKTKLGTVQQSFFHCSPQSSDTFAPIAPHVHKAITVSQFLRQKLRWITLGGQYNWTQKAYPHVVPPTFPADIGDLIHGIFPNMKPEAAIVNIYSPGDTLALHQDVSEESNAGLISVSFGCDGLFVIGIDGPNEERKEPQCIAVRLRSGDAVHMNGPSRYAWHGVPLIIPDTCPNWLGTWPATAELSGPTRGPETPKQFEAWQGWLASKRVNLNVRQMRG